MEYKLSKSSEKDINRLIEYKNRTIYQYAKDLSSEEIDRINIAIDQKKDSKNKRIIKFLDLIFRFVAMVMSLVTLMLCINENIDVKALVVLLSIGLVCSSMTLLPKIDK